MSSLVAVLEWMAYLAVAALFALGGYVAMCYLGTRLYQLWSVHPLRTGWRLLRHQIWHIKQRNR